jgi:hypothetical protein
MFAEVMTGIPINRRCEARLRNGAIVAPENPPSS